MIQESRGTIISVGKWQANIQSNNISGIESYIKKYPQRAYGV